MNDRIPSHGRQIVSTLSADGTLVIELVDAPVVPPGPDDVLVKIEAAPINPSDLLTLMPTVDLSTARFEGSADRPVVIAQLSPEATRVRAGRFGKPQVVGLEGAGTVVAAGENARGLLGKSIAAISIDRGFYGEYRTFAAAECVILPAGISAGEGAGLFVNPMTALAIAEAAKMEGHKALIHTAAASNLGRMLVKICAEDGVPLVNVVRRQEHVELLQTIGATHVVNSTSTTFHADLVDAIKATGATIAFDALGGGRMAGDLLAAMEAAAVSRMQFYSPYGSYERKKAYIYGLLDTSPSVLNHMDYGMLWTLDGFLMPEILEKAGLGRTMELRQRVLDNAKTIFASHYTKEISLEDILKKEIMSGYHRQATGEKFLIRMK